MESCVLVLDVVTRYFTCNRLVIYLFLENRDLTEFDSKWDGGLTRLGGKVLLIFYCTEDQVRQNSQGHPPIES